MYVQFNMKKLFQQYKRLEANNDHDEAAMLLIKNFGTAEEKEIMEGIIKRHRKLGYIEDADRELRYQISQKYYKLLVNGVHNLNQTMYQTLNKNKKQP